MREPKVQGRGQFIVRSGRRLHRASFRARPKTRSAAACRAVCSVVFRTGGKADTPARKTSGPSAGHAAPERVFGRAGRLARCKERSRSARPRIAVDRCRKSNGCRSPPLRTAPARQPTLRLVACPNPRFPHRAATPASIRLHVPCDSSGVASALRFWRPRFPADERSRAASQAGVRVSFPRPCLPFRARERDPNPNPRTQST